MKNRIKNLTIACCSVFAIASPAVAQNSNPKDMKPDSLIVMSQDELVNQLVNVIEKVRSERAISSSSSNANLRDLSTEDIKLLKYQMLLNALGLFQRPMQMSLPSSNGGGYPNENAYYQTGGQSMNYPFPVYQCGGQPVVYVPQNGQPFSQYGNSLQHEAAKADSKSQLSPDTNANYEIEIAALRDRIKELENTKKNDKTAQNAEKKYKDGFPMYLKEEPANLIAPYFQRQVFFCQGKTNLDYRSRQTLNEVITILSQDPTAQLRLVGYASPEGSKSVNERLINQRARAVYTYLIKRGVDASRLHIFKGSIDRGVPSMPTVARRVDLSVYNEQ